MLVTRQLAGLERRIPGTEAVIVDLFYRDKNTILLFGFVLTEGSSLLFCLTEGSSSCILRCLLTFHPSTPTIKHCSSQIQLLLCFGDSRYTRHTSFLVKKADSSSNSLGTCAGIHCSSSPLLNLSRSNLVRTNAHTSELVSQSKSLKV